jgi:hypothetical protein
MNTTEKQRLLRDVLENEAYCAARNEIVAGVLADAQRRRARDAWTRRALALAACVPIAAGIYIGLLQLGSSKTSDVTIVRTQPLRQEEIVRTATGLGAIGNGKKLLIVKTGGETVEFVHTSRTTEELSDQELLALFKGRPVALVSVSAHERQLILLDNDERGPGTRSTE